jgi:adenylate cyclase
VCSGITMVGYRVFVSDRDKRRLHDIFGLYLAPSVVDQLAAGDKMPELGGERREMTFLFTDVANFTTLSERTDPGTLAVMLNSYLERVCEIIMNRGGFVSEFLGDGIVAFFGVPLSKANHAASAIDCAAELVLFTEAFSCEKQDSGIAFGHTRFGIHSGTALVGNFGSHKRLKYSALGDVVNTASRIEGLNKFFGTRIAVSATAIAGLDGTRFRPLGEFVLKGKTEVLAVFEPLTRERAGSDYIGRYREAYAQLQAGSESALSLFEALSLQAPTDGCVAFHLSRLRSGYRTPLIHMDEK